MITRRLIISPPPQLLIVTISLLLLCILLLHLPSPAHCASSSSSSSGSSSSSSSYAAGSGGGTYGGRHSYSLSTFSPSGGIDQVVRATRASMLGSPIVAMSVPRRCWSGAGGGDDDGGVEEDADAPPPEMEEKEKEEEGGGSPSSSPASATGSGGDPRRRRRRPVPPGGGGIYLAMPLAHLASSPLIVDDGTPRVVRITSSAIAIHSGVGADGRALCDAASRLAAEHERAHGEEARSGDLLMGISEIVREVTMRAGSRPYGCALLVGCLGDDDGRENENDDDAGGGGPTMYRVDPSGAVVLLDPPVAAGDRGGGGGGGVGNRGGGVSSSPAVAFLGNWDAASGPPSHRRQTATTMDEARRTLEGRKYATEDEVRDALMNVAKRTFVFGGSSSSSSSSSTGDDGGGGEDSHDTAATAGRGGGIIGGSTRTEEKRPMLYASFTRERGLRVSRINI